MSAMIQIENVSKTFAQQAVLRHISMTMQKGNIYGLIGPSGAGKTTLVKMLVGMHGADEGVIRVLDRQVPDLHVLKHVGYMAQSDALYEELTGLENLSFFAELYDMTKAEQAQSIRYAADLVNLTDELKKKVALYSGGMKRRLSLGIALLQNPEVLILDEPTVGIDPELRAAIWQELNRLKSEKTIIITTHVMDEAERCDHIAMIRDGQVLADGSPSQLKNQFDAVSFEDVFLRAGRSSS